MILHARSETASLMTDVSRSKVAFASPPASRKYTTEPPPAAAVDTEGPHRAGRDQDFGTAPCGLALRSSWVDTRKVAMAPARLTASSACRGAGRTGLCP